jgi:hypothetical protein
VHCVHCAQVQVHVLKGYTQNRKFEREAVNNSEIASTPPATRHPLSILASENSDDFSVKGLGGPWTPAVPCSNLVSLIVSFHPRETRFPRSRCRGLSFLSLDTEPVEQCQDCKRDSLKARLIPLLLESLNLFDKVQTLCCVKCVNLFKSSPPFSGRALLFWLAPERPRSKGETNTNKPTKSASFADLREIFCVSRSLFYVLV